MARIDAVRDLAGVLRRVEKPARYVGGEYGSVLREEKHGLAIVLSYPDLYEIGMSNSAVRILYTLLNGIEGVACERVFAAAPDFEAELRARGLPLFSLESGRELASFDLVGFSLGYELTLTNLLAILDLGGIPLLSVERGEGDPIVIAGGPACTNPVPYGLFVDCVFIGEAEGWAAALFPRLVGMKRSGAPRAELLGVLRADPCVWHAGKAGPARRALWRGFARAVARSGLPVPSMRVVQDHGTVEIMRGCPNACRFCHAACYYRPTRSKLPGIIAEETDALVRGSGYREVTLASLSSGDFRDIHGLVRGLNAAYAPLRVSFSLPSLRVDSLGLSLLEEISEVRKSGLTFAVETALPEWQEQVNKSVPLDKTIAILREAKTQGWKSAKFYFMVGLPASFDAEEATSIIEYLREAREATRMTIHTNVAVFIPKPHTPYERAAQLREAQGLEKVMAVRRGLGTDGFKFGYHSPFLAMLEAIVSRGDERAGLLALEAFRAGARLDAWEEHIQVDTWRSVIAAAPWDVEGETCRARGPVEPLPWSGVTLHLSESVLYGGDNGEVPAAVPTAPPAAVPTAPPAAAAPAAKAPPLRALFSFRKQGRAAYLAHLDLMTVFERALARAGLPVSFTEGFNPKPRLEFASPLGLGIDSEEEIASVELEGWDCGEAFSGALTRSLPDGLEVTRAELMPRTPTGKKPSLMAAFWGSEFRVSPPSVMPALAPDGVIREVARAEGHVLLRLPVGPASKTLLRALRDSPVARVCRTRSFAAAGDGQPVSYFEALGSSRLT